MKSVPTLALAVIALGACKHEAPPTPQAPQTTYTCRVSVHARRSADLNVSGQGNGPTADQATASAWTAACAALPETERGHCHDTAHFTPNVMTASAVANGTTNYSVTVQLSPEPGPDSRGQGTSHTSSDDACHQAVTQACQAAGATGDCVAAGTHEEGSRSSEMTRM